MRKDIVNGIVKIIRIIIIKQLEYIIIFLYPLIVTINLRCLASSILCICMMFLYLEISYPMLNRMRHLTFLEEVARGEVKIIIDLGSCLLISAMVCSQFSQS